MIDRTEHGHEKWSLTRWLFCKTKNHAAGFTFWLMHKYLHIVHLTFHNFTPINFLTQFISYIISLLSHSYFGNEMIKVHHWPLYQQIVHSNLFPHFSSSSSKTLQYISSKYSTMMIYVGQYATRCSRSPIQ